MITSLLESAREASYALAQMSEDVINDILRKVADSIVAHTDQLLAANQRDLGRMDPQSPLYDRLRLTPERIADIAADMRHVATLPSPLGRVLSHTVLPNGLDLERVSVPFGVVGVVYEARPNVTTDAAAVAIKSGNAVILKGGSEALRTNLVLAEAMRSAAREAGLPENAIQIVNTTDRSAVADPPKHHGSFQSYQQLHRRICLYDLIQI